MDRRIARTRDSLCDALLDLMIEKGYEAITVQDLIDRANVGRSTFYSHFDNKDQLLAENIDNLKRFLMQRCANGNTAATPSRPLHFRFCLEMLLHAQGNKRIYRAVAGNYSGRTVVDQMKMMLAELVKEEVEHHKKVLSASNLPLPVVVEFVVNTFMTLLTWWMEQPTPCSAGEVDEMFHKLVLNGIR